MDATEKSLRQAVVEGREPKEPLKNVKENLPGQQIGLYSDNQEKDVCQMTKTLNNPGESSQDDRG